MALHGSSLPQTVPSIPDLYLGQIGTRCFEPTAKIQATNYLWSRDLVFNVVPIPAGTTVTVGWAFWHTTANSELYLTGTTSFDSRIEIGGSFISPNEGIASFDMAGTSKLLLRTFTINNYVPAFTSIFVRGLQDGPGVFWRQGQILDQAPGTSGDVGPSNGTRPGIQDSFTNFSEYSFPPILFAMQTRNPSALLFHDSREECGNESGRPPYWNNGLITPAIAASFGYSSVGHSGYGLNQFLTASVKTQRLALAPYFSHIGNAYGVNDLNAYSRTAAQLLTDRATFAALFPNNIVFGTTIAPVTSSTDGWATLANQGLGTVTPKIRDANDGIRAGIVGERFILDTADAIDPYKSGKWPVTRNPNDTARATSCTFTGSVANGSPYTTLVVTAISSGALNVGDPITDNLTAGGYTWLSGCTILEQLTGTTGSTGNYRISRPQRNGGLSSRTLYVGAYGTNDSLHQTKDLSEQVMQKLLPQVRANMVR